jgi:Rrf2 family protein
MMTRRVAVPQSAGLAGSALRDCTTTVASRRSKRRANKACDRLSPTWTVIPRGLRFAYTRSMRTSMKLSQAVQYALIALTQLNYGPTSPPKLLRDIEDSGKLPHVVLKSIMQTLVTRGLVVGARGPHGGYWLARPAKRITLMDVVIAFDGPVKGDSDEFTAFILESGARKIRQALICHAHMATTRLRRVSLADLMASALLTPPDRHQRRDLAIGRYVRPPRTHCRSRTFAIVVSGQNTLISLTAL